MDTDSGEWLWRYQTRNNVESSPTVVDGVVYMGSKDGYLYALNTDTRRLLWRYETGTIVKSSPAVAEGVVYVGTLQGHVYALEARNRQTAVAV